MTSFSLKKALWGHHRRNQLRLLYQSTFYQELERGRSFPYRSVESFPCFLLGTVPSENPTLLLGSAVAADMWQKLLPELGEISKRLLMSARDRHIEKRSQIPEKGKVCENMFTFWWKVQSSSALRLSVVSGECGSLGGDFLFDWFCVVREEFWFTGNITSLTATIVELRQTRIYPKLGCLMGL